MPEVEMTHTFAEWQAIAERLHRRDPDCTVGHMLRNWIDTFPGGIHPADDELIKMGLTRTSALKVMQAEGLLEIVHVTS